MFVFFFAKVEILMASRAQYGAPSDFDEWAEIIADDSWSYKNLKPRVHFLQSVDVELMMISDSSASSKSTHRVPISQLWTRATMVSTALFKSDTSTKLHSGVKASSMPASIRVFQRIQILMGVLVLWGLAECVILYYISF